VRLIDAALHPSTARGAPLGWRPAQRTPPLGVAPVPATPRRTAERGPSQER